MTTLPGCFRYLPGWVDRPEQLYADLVEQLPWEQHDITVAGRTTKTPRLTCWMGDAAYTYSGVRNEPRPLPAPLVELQDRLSAESGATYNSCLANLYRDGRDSIGYHSDNERELGDRPTIASISLGSRRAFQVRHVGSGERWTLQLGAGDLLIMSGESQSDYRHGVPKTSREVGPRMNLTFRHFLT
ncbi:MAG: alpha-ketoglutarate-dependent dioxygenase AlkB [Microlunatus sp.]|nr:alpha-ketoglutarate-dependent dioxygenase AlkB [Microlunatus sp.]